MEGQKGQATAKVDTSYNWISKGTWAAMAVFAYASWLAVPYQTASTSSAGPRGAQSSDFRSPEESPQASTDMTGTRFFLTAVSERGITCPKTRASHESKGSPTECERRPRQSADLETSHLNSVKRAMMATRYRVRRKGPQKLQNPRSDL